MARVRQAQKCTAKAGRRRDPETGERLRCEAYAVEGLTVCSAHGGRAPRAVEAARRNVLKAKAERSALRLLGDPAEQRDPAEYLLEALYRAATLEQVLAEEIAQLDPDNPARALLEEHDNDDGSSYARVHPLVR